MCGGGLGTFKKDKKYRKLTARIENWKETFFVGRGWDWWTLKKDRKYRNLTIRIENWKDTSLKWNFKKKGLLQAQTQKKKKIKMCKLKYITEKKENNNIWRGKLV